MLLHGESTPRSHKMHTAVPQKTVRATTIVQLIHHPPLIHTEQDPTNAKRRKFDRKRHAEPVKRAEPRFCSHPTVPSVFTPKRQQKKRLRVAPIHSGRARRAAIKAMAIHVTFVNEKPKPRAALTFMFFAAGINRGVKFSGDAQQQFVCSRQKTRSAPALQKNLGEKPRANTGCRSQVLPVASKKPKPKHMTRMTASCKQSKSNVRSECDMSA